MIRRSLREWDYLPVQESPADDVVSRKTADSLIAVARAAGIGGVDDQAVLVDRHGTFKRNKLWACSRPQP